MAAAEVNEWGLGEIRQTTSSFCQMRELELLSELQDTLGALTDTGCEGHALSLQMGKCSITGKFLKVAGGTTINRSSLVWVHASLSSLLYAGLC